MKLDDVIARWNDTPFDYGTADCGAFVGECLEAVSGVNPAEYVDYSDFVELDLMVEDAGGLENLVSSLLGEPVEREPQNNDVVMCTLRGTQLLGFVWNDMILLRTKSGLIDWPKDKADCAWAP